MKVYLVGGAVRDELLQRPIKDRDYVVVGSTPDEMLALGYEQVGADFPVFLHPETKEEYALARTERKVSGGYHGFVTDFNPSTTLEDDLKRRDLTINAMAKDLETGEIIDPFNGQQDLAEGILRHVSPAFAEDPVRILRVARFRARYGFKVAQETKDLMSKLVSIGEIDHLTSERVWLELEKGFSEPYPVLFVVTLLTVDAWDRLFKGIRVGVALNFLNRATDKTFVGKLMLMFAASPKEAVNGVLERYKAPASIVRTINVFKRLEEVADEPVSPHSALTILKEIDAFRRPEDLKLVLSAMTDVLPNFEQFIFVLYTMYEQMDRVTFSSLSANQQGLSGREIAKAIDDARIATAVKWMDAILSRTSS